MADSVVGGGSATGRLVMNEHRMHRERIMELVGSARNQRMRPIELTQQLAKESGLSANEVNKIIKELVDEEDLVFSFRDPCSYVEIPCNGCEGGHRAARPMKVVMDSKGSPWLCDKEFDGTEALLAKNCWDYSVLPFTRT